MSIPSCVSSVFVRLDGGLDVGRCWTASIVYSAGDWRDEGAETRRHEFAVLPCSYDGHESPKHEDQQHILKFELRSPPGKRPAAEPISTLSSGRARFFISSPLWNQQQHSIAPHPLNYTPPSHPATNRL